MCLQNCIVHRRGLLHAGAHGCKFLGAFLHWPPLQASSMQVSAYQRSFCLAARSTLWPAQQLHQQQWIHPRPTLCHRVSTRPLTVAAAAKGNAPPGWQCGNCGAVYYQQMGRCSSCQQFGTIDRVQQAPPEPKGSSGITAASKALRRAASATAPAARRRAIPVNDESEGLSDSWLDSSDDGLYGYSYPSGLLPAAGGWVQPEEDAPRKLSDIAPTSAVPRIPLPGPAGQEMSRVLGGGVVPGSMVLIGGDPGVGKSTLLLQVAALIAKTCQATQPTPAATYGKGSKAAGSNGKGSKAAKAAAAAADGASDEEEAAEGTALTQGRCVLYVSAEETQGQVADRAYRLGIDTCGLPLYLSSSSNMVAVLEQVAERRPVAVVLDSIQTVMLVDSALGSVKQVKECTNALLRIAKATNTAVFVISHVTKDGTMAGPQTLMHMVDVVLYLEGERNSPERLLRAEKNRFGRVGEVGLFTMATSGLDILQDASHSLLEDVSEGPGSSAHLGSALTVVLEGIRPRTIEIQALCSTNDDSSDEDAEAADDAEGLQLLGAGGLPPRRAAEPRLYPAHRAVGLEDRERLIMLLDILSANTRIKSRKFGLWVSPVKGYKVAKQQTGADLAILAAVVSSYANLPLPPQTVLIGEVRLNGRIAEVPDLEARLYEAAKVGASQAIIPERNQCKLTPSDLAGMKLIPVATLQDALVHLFDAKVVLPRKGRGASRGAAVGQLSGTWRAPKRSTSSRGYSTGPGAAGSAAS